jgi:hypothetical protein
MNFRQAALLTRIDKTLPACIRYDANGILRASLSVLKFVFVENCITERHACTKHACLHALTNE